MKKNVSVKYLLGAVAALSLAFSAEAQYTNHFDSSSAPFRHDFGNGVTPTASWSTNDAGGNSGSGSAKLNWNWNGSAGGEDFTADILSTSTDCAGATLSFDIFVDTNSTPGNYNDFGYFEMHTRYNGGSYTYGPKYLGTSLVGGGMGMPTAAGHWSHVSLVLGAEASTLRALTFQDYNDSGRGPINGPMTVYIDNLTITPQSATNIPVLKLAKSVKGLNVFASSSGIYDRQSAVLQTNQGLSWVGQATGAHPVTYSFTINSLPQDPGTYGCSAHMWLIPNPAGTENSADYNEANGVIVSVTQNSATEASMSFGYKVNQANGNNMYYGLGVYTNTPGSWDGVTTPYYESGKLGIVTNSGTALGTWSVRFTSDTNVTLIAPSGSTASYVIPNYNASYFAESTGFSAYLGMVPNNTGSINQGVSYSSFAIAGNVNPFADNFLADTAIDTNHWNTAVAHVPSAVLVIPASAPYWLAWTNIPLGYSLQTGSNLASVATWTSPNLYPVLSFVGENHQLVAQSELAPGNTGFFNLVKRGFTQLQVLLPGQVNAPGTALGYVGTPTTISLAAQGFNPTTVTVNACDATWHIINGASDQIHLSTSDGSAFLPADLSLSNGTVTFSGANGVLFQTTGPQTVTATDYTDGTKTPNTSAPVTIDP